MRSEKKSEAAAMAAMMYEHMSPSSRRRWEGQVTYDMEHYSVVSSKLGKAEAAEFRRMCHRRHTTPYRVVGALVRLWMDEVRGEERDAQ